MTPTSFTFNLTVPRDARLAEVVRELAAHAVDYAEFDETMGEGFVDRVGALATRRFAAGGAPTCQLVYGCEQGILYVTLDGETIKSN
jgi:hypothetical protein